MSGLTSDEWETLVLGLHGLTCHIHDGASCGVADEFDQEDATLLAPTIERIIAERERAAVVRALRDAALDFPLSPNVTLQGVRICEMLHARADRIEQEDK